MKVPLLRPYCFTSPHLPVEKLALIPRVKKMGWNQQNLGDLKIYLGIMLLNFEMQIKVKTNFEIILTHHTPPERGKVVLIDQKTKAIYVFLKPRSKRFMEEAALVLSRELSDLAIRAEAAHRGFLALTGFPLEIEPEKIQLSVPLLVDFLVKERGLKVDEGFLAENFASIIEHYIGELNKQRLSLSFFSRANLPVRVIEDEIKQDISRFRLEAKQRVIVREKEGDIYCWWGKIAHLALLSVIAQSIGNPRLAAACRRMFFLDQPLRERLAYTSFSYIFSDFTEMIPFQNHPIETKRQMALAKKEAEMLFVIFEEIFQSHYNGFLAEPEASEDLPLPASLN